MDWPEFFAANTVGQRVPNQQWPWFRRQPLVIILLQAHATSRVDGDRLRPAPVSGEVWHSVHRRSVSHSGMKADILIHLAMFAKYWQLGQVKTRLASSVGASAARDVYLVLLQHLVKRFSRFGDQRTVVFSPPESRPRFRDLLPGEWDLEEQASGDLGNRLRTFLADNLDAQGTKLIVIGSDTPDLPVSYVGRAVDLLSEFPVVIGPSQDGGYYLIGMRRLVPDIFDGITWSTNQVLQQTIERLHNRNCPYGLLPSLNDVDDLADLMQLMNKLRNNERDRLDDELLRKLDGLELNHA